MAVSSSFELNDTLQITKEQGFPDELVKENHFVTPLVLTEELGAKVFSFHNKPGLRNFAVPPVRCFLVENIDGKRLYRGQCHILSVQIDYVQRVTSGTYRIIKLFTPEQMRHAFQIVDRYEEMNYFTS